MDRFQIENLYKANGLMDYKLRNTDDIYKTHGIDIKAVKGYEKLDDVNKQLYERFIVNFFNALGLDSRATLIPKGIYYVEDTQLSVKEKTEDDHYTGAGMIVKAIDKDGKKTILHNWIYKGFKGLEILKHKSTYYLRIEYEHKKNKEWLHVLKDYEWY